MSAFGSLRAAAALLTRLPVGQAAISAKDAAWAPVYYPIVGGLLGGATGLFFHLLAPLGFAAAVLAIGLMILLTGALHEDGLADTADGFGGQVSREQTLKIMKDSRIGTYGVVALVIVLVCRVSLLAKLEQGALGVLILTCGWARLAPLWLMTHLPHAAPAQAKNQSVLCVPRSRAWLGSLVAVGMGLILQWRGMVTWQQLFKASIAVALVSLLMARLAWRRLGGITGDVLGASEQLVEVALLGIFAWHV